MTTVWIKRQPLSGANWKTFFDSMLAVTRWDKDAEVFSYMETVTSCDLTRQRIAEIMEPLRPLEGRFFRDPLEVRWLMNSDGAFTAWMIQESVASSSGEESVNKVERPYYLIGIATETPGEFKEAKFPGKVFNYPAVGGSRERAYIRVAEYYRRKPNAFDHQDIETATIDAVLAMPMLVAHRFIDVGAGHGAGLKAAGKES